MSQFKKIHERALKRKHGAKGLNDLLPSVLDHDALAKIPDHRFLAMMTKCINQAGFSWKVIEQKWPEFEEAFYQFNLDKLSLLSDDQWENYVKDTRVVRNWQKIKTVKDNLIFILDIQYEYTSFAKFISDWPSSDQISLLQILKKRGARLGGNTGQRLLRNMGKDAFVLSRDVIMALQDSGLDIKDNPSSQREMKLIQARFNDWHEETNLPYAHLSRIAACSIGENYI